MAADSITEFANENAGVIEGEEAGAGAEDSGEDEAEIDQQVQEIMAEKTATAADKIVRLHDLGFTHQQLIEELGFNAKTVYAAVPARPKKKTGTELVESGPMFPATKKTDVITVENIFQHLTNGDPKMKYRYEGMLMLKAAMLMLADQANIDKMVAQTEAFRIKPLLEMISVSRAELDAATARSKESNFAIARAAANQALGNYVGEIDRHIPKAPATPPAKEMSEIVPRVLSKVSDKVVDVVVDKILEKVVPGYNKGPDGKTRDGWEEEVRQSPTAPPPAAASSDDGWIAETRQAEIG